jgi:hypothetical protein
LAVAAALLAAPVAGAGPDPNGGGQAPPPRAEVVTIDRFDWADAGIGAGVVAAGLIGLAALAGPLTRQLRPTAPPPAS